VYATNSLSTRERTFETGRARRTSLPGGFLAYYEWNGREGLIFISDLESPGMAERAFDLFYSFQSDRGEILKRVR